MDQKEQRALRKEGKKRCGDCKQIFDLTSFYLNKKKTKSGTICNTYASCCKECVGKKRVGKPRGPYKQHKEVKPLSKSMPNKPKNYITSDQLHCELVVSLEMGRLTNKASMMMKLLCDKLIKKFYYTDLDLRADCLSSMYEDVFTYWFNYNPYHESAFAYISEIAKRGAAKGINLHKKQKGRGEGEYFQIISLDRGNPEGGGIFNI